MNHLPRKLKIGKALALASIVTMILNSSVYYLTQADGSLSLLLVQTVPLLLFIPGIHINHYRTYSWLCFVVLFYFIVAVTNVMSPFAKPADWVLLVATVVLFNAAMMTSHWLQQALQAQFNAHQPR